MGNHKTSSPEKLNRYTKIQSPGGNLLIAVLVILAAALIVWAVIGRIPVTTAEVGVVVDREHLSHTCLSFIDAKKRPRLDLEGKSVTVTMADGKSFSGTVTQMEDTPISAEEVRKEYAVQQTMNQYNLSDWILDTLLGDSKYFYVLIVETEEDISAYWRMLAKLTIILDEVRPISYLLN